MEISIHHSHTYSAIGNDYVLCVVCIQDYFRTLFHVIFSDQYIAFFAMFCTWHTFVVLTLLLSCFGKE